MDRDKAYRYAIYQRLQGLGVPVYDSKLEDDTDLYVILASQTAQRDHTFTDKQWKVNIDIEICHRQQNSATFDTVDDIGEMIENLLTTELPMVGNLVEQTGWDFYLTELATATSMKLQEYQDTAGFIAIKTLQFSSKAIKQ